MVKRLNDINLKNVQDVYNSPEGDLWELIMGEQIHIGGFATSTDLAEKAGIGQGMKGIYLCRCNGGGIRFLVRFRNVASAMDVDATETVVERDRERCRNERLADKIQFTLADATDYGLPGGEADFIWGEDAWCYVVDKSKLISEAAHLVKPGDMIAFTDWVEGATGMNDEEVNRYLTFIKFPNILTIQEYSDLLEQNGCDVLVAEDTGRFSPYVDLYLNMVNMQYTSDAAKIFGFDMGMMQAIGGEMVFMQGLARTGKIAQGCFVAKKK